MIKINDENFKLYEDDCFEILDTIEEHSVNLIFMDPPYFLSNGGVTCKSGKFSKVDKGEWNKTISIKEKLEYYIKLFQKCKRILKENGSIFISGTLHNIYSAGTALELEGFKILNNITWIKPNPAPNLSCKYFTRSTETIIWAKLDNKETHVFNYAEMKKINDNKQMKDNWIIKLPSKSEKQYGKHPTQKPLELLERIILAASNENDIVLDPFNGSGTTGIAVLKLKRKFIGIELDPGFNDICIKRYKEFKNGEK
ncbi:DNA-methyltransferase [Mycoplasmopsis adleri]|uniref:DNA-methyltransferase n=1 Tax=Mycoplasmopsis adleri TaxID=51362 RepID=UPI003872FADF